MPANSDSSSDSRTKQSASSISNNPPEDSESHLNRSSTPIYTPSATPPSEAPLRDSDHKDRTHDHDRDLQTNMSDAPGTSATAVALESKEEVEPSIENPASKSEPKAALNNAASESSPKKAVCKKHSSSKQSESSRKRNDKKKAKPTGKDSSSSDSDSWSSSASSDSSDLRDSESEESDSSDSDSEEQRQRRKRKAKAKAKKSKKDKKKSQSRKVEDDSESDSDDSSDEESSPDEKARKKAAAKHKAKKKSKKLRRKEECSEDPEDEECEEEENPDVAILKAQEKLAALKLKRAEELRSRGQGGYGRGGGLGYRGNRRTATDSQTDGQKRNQQKSKGKGKRASKIAFKRVDQLWDNTIHNYKLTETRNDPGADEWDQYIFTVRRKFDWENKYIETVVDIKSKYLRDALAKVMDGVKGVSLVQETAVVDPNMLFLYLEETRQHMKELKRLSKTEKKKKARKLAAAKAAHLKVLIKYLDKDYAETKKTLYPLLEANMITFDLLWALFKPNTISYTTTYGHADEPRAFKIEYAYKESSFVKGQWYSIEGRYLEYDGKSFGMGTMAAEVEAFKGARKITSLSCYPLKYHRDAEGIKAQLIERGKKFVALRGMNYRFHKGMAFYKKKRSIIKVNINGRVMIDPALHRLINPDYPISTVRPKDPDILDPSDSERDAAACCCAVSDSDSDCGPGRRESDEPKYTYKVVQDKDGRPHVVQVELDENGNEIQKEDIEKIAGEGKGASEHEFTEEELLIASPVVLGFAFSEKLWLEFSVSGISEIEWNEDAFDSLVLPDNQKSIVKALVESHTFHAAENIDDVIQGKGKGLVAVLHGPPGTGKTLTAEGIAELLKRPLYMVSSGELGTDSRTLEGELNKILDIAHSWGAVLLLDEADVFLEKRTIQDIHRNALVSIFLRLLEYFQGILFLTTNRVETFDDAFQSRIHIALRYGDLTPKARRSVWKMFLEKVRAKDGVETVKFTEKDYDMLARNNLNGRQIKNSVRTAQALAVNEKTPLSMAHILRVLEVAETFDQDLRGGTGYIDAMRSYT